MQRRPPGGAESCERGRRTGGGEGVVGGGGGGLWVWKGKEGEVGVGWEGAIVGVGQQVG